MIQKNIFDNTSMIFKVIYERERPKERDTETERQRDRQRERETDRHTEKERDRETKKYVQEVLPHFILYLAVYN